ncbi:uncharacterized protein LOC144866026 isoform X1 [Branchiostoma floridae x Branchiostoma japonicum]
MASCTTARVKTTPTGNYCVAGGPNGVSCKNGQSTKGISMHRFPQVKNDGTEADKERQNCQKARKLWIKFVERHRPGFKPSATSSLCSAHFEPSCFTTNLEIAERCGMSRRLVRGAVPTIDTAGLPTPSAPVTERTRRRIIKELLQTAAQDQPAESRTPKTQQPVKKLLKTAAHGLPAQSRTPKAQHTVKELLQIAGRYQTAPIRTQKTQQTVKELLQTARATQGQTAQSRTPKTKQTVKEEDGKEKNLGNAENNSAASQLSCATAIKDEAMHELQKDLVSCCNSTAQLLSFDAVGTDIEKKNEEMNPDHSSYHINTSFRLSCTVGTVEGQKELDPANCYNTNTPCLLSSGQVDIVGEELERNAANWHTTNTPSLLSCSTPCIKVKKQGGQEANLANGYNTAPSQLSCNTVATDVQTHSIPASGDAKQPAKGPRKRVRTRKPAKSQKRRARSNRIKECVPVKVDYVGPALAASDNTQGLNDTVENSGLTLMPIIVYQPSSSQDISEVSKELHLQSRKQVLEPKKVDHNNSKDTNGTSSQGIVADIINKPENDLSNGKNTIDAKEKNLLEEEDDFEEELSSSEDEKKKKRKGYESDGSWHLSSEEDELFDDSDGSASSCDSDWLEETERQRQKERRKHNLKRKKKTTWVCKCQEKFTSEASYREHKLEAHPVTCEYCDMKFPSAQTLEKHLKTHLPSKDKLDLKGNKLFLCDHCGQFFNNKDFKRHELALSEACPYKCEWKNCKSAFKRMFTLRNHIRHVHEKNRFPCPYEGCTKTFGVRSVMMKHYKVHTDERSHQCSYCGKMFQRPDHLRVHTRTHTGATPFNCSLCNYGGRQANCLRWHMKTHHPEHCKKSGKSGAKNGGRPRKKL